jgi:PAS domain S-box-containing protein
MWTIILLFYVSRIRSRRLKSRLIYTLIIILAIDAFRTLFESLYFGAWYTSLAGFIPQEVHTFLVRPEMVIIPKLLNVIAATVIIVILLRRWLPQEEFEISQLESIIKERTSELVATNEELKREIGERKRAEQAILESEKFFSGILNDMLTFIAVLEPDGKVIFVNNTPLDVAGITLNDVKGKMFHDSFWWQYSEQARQQIKEDIRICATGESLVHDIEILAAGGELIWIEYSMHPVYNKNGKIKYLVPEGRDITERKQAEDHILYLQNVLKAIRDVNQLIVHEKNRQKLLQGACDILTQTRNYKLVWIGLTQEGVQEVLPAAQAGFEEGYLKTIKITMDDSATGKGPTGTAIRTQKPSIMRNIAGDPGYEPWREEALMRGYTSSAAIPLVYENRVFGALNMYTVLADAFDDEEIDLLVEVGQDIAFALHNIEMEEERKRAEEALRKIHEELEERVTERTRELAQANIQLKEMDRLKSEFLATMSHELRTPLNSIIGFVGIILHGIVGEINEEQKKQLSMVYSSARHLLSLINDILDLSRIESGKMETSLTRFKIEEVVSEVTQTLSPVISQKGLRLVTEMPDETPEIYSDRKKVLQILLNLVNNAVKFTNEGEIKIDCTVDNHNLEVSVSDTGIGIKRENMSYLFEAFRQVDGSSQRRYEGAGLGLYLCRKLVTLLGGKIWAESEYEKGSRFTFTLPVSPGKGVQQEKEDLFS